MEDESGKNDGVGYVVASSLDEVNPSQIAKQGVEEALSKLGGKSIPSGTYNIIMYNEAMVQILETFASTFSGDAAQKDYLFKRKRRRNDSISHCYNN